MSLYVNPQDNDSNKRTLIGDPAGEPFVVRASTRVNGRSGGWIPVNMLIWAKDKEAAILAVRSHIENMVKNGWGRIPDQVLAECTFEAEAFDKRCTAEAVWAINDYTC